MRKEKKEGKRKEKEQSNRKVWELIKGGGGRRNCPIGEQKGGN
jgi:hypothetical protein